MEHLINIIRKNSLLFSFVLSLVFVIDLTEAFVVNDFYQGAFVPGLFLVIKTVLFFYLYKVIYNEVNPLDAIRKLSDLPRYGIMKTIINVMMVIYLFMDVSAQLAGHSVFVRDLVESGSTQSFIEETSVLKLKEPIDVVSPADQEDVSEIIVSPDSSSTSDSLSNGDKVIFVALSTLTIPISFVLFSIFPLFYHLFFCKFFFQRSLGSFLENVNVVFSSISLTFRVVIKEYWKHILFLSFLMSLVLIETTVSHVPLTMLTIVTTNILLIISFYYLSLKRAVI